MYRKFLVLASKQDEAGMNIVTQLSQFRKNPVSGILSREEKYFDIFIVDNSILFEENLNLNQINEYDFVIFASKHKSEKHTKSLTVHAPGNLSFEEPKFGGKKGKVCIASAVFQKQIFKKLRDNAEKSVLKKYNVTMEATHHGPLINKPCLFIEIGATEEEWKDKRAGFAVAKTISEAIQEFKENKYHEIAVGIGGPHYCPEFNKLQLDSNVAISHVIPKYISPITEEMIKEVWKKTDEEVDFAIVDWKGLGGAEQRQKVVEVFEKTQLPWKKLDDIDR